MLETIVGLVWTAFIVYATVGVAFGIPLLFFWSSILDASAKAGTLGSRLAILPGAIALWPIMARKTWRAIRQGAESPDLEQPVTPAAQRLIHGVAVVLLAGVLPAICVLALLGRPREQLHPASQLQPEPLPDVISLARPMPEGLPLNVVVRTNGRSET